MRELCRSWLLSPEHNDDRTADRLTDEADDFSVDEFLQTAATSRFLRGLGAFDFALFSGDNTFAARAIEALSECEAASSEFNLVTLWWASKLAKNLISDLWQHSLHQQLPPEIGGESRQWGSLRGLFIHHLLARRIAEVELWPSQTEAAHRAIDPTDDLVVSLPTSAGKTRIAELCILRALAQQRRIVHVTPLRALSAQVERDLRHTFQPLGFTISSLYGASGEVGLDADTLANRDIVVSTPEKLDFAIRQEPSLLDNVGLIVLDEAHTIGPGEREVRYEVLVQRLLRRTDAHNRRLVCLSAILPKGQQLDDFVSWIRQGEVGDAVISNWRPTRQRFGTIVWTGASARLNLAVEGERPFISRFVTRTIPTGRRKAAFPRNAQELTIAAAWRIAGEGRSALIFCPERRSVEPLAQAVLNLQRWNLLQPLTVPTDALDRARNVGKEWLGSDHPAVRCLDLGVAVHHARLPKAFLREIEHLLRNRTLRLVISSPTLAQGLNLSASSLLMYSLHRRQELIRGEEFANIIGRAGRAWVDIDGQVLYVVYEDDVGRRRWKLSQWAALQKQARQRQIQSGLFTVVALILQKLREELSLDGEALLEYVAGNTEIWSKVFEHKQGEDATLDQTLASLDTALLALVERLDCATGELPKLLDEILKDSLWARTLAHADEPGRLAQQAILETRAKLIWESSTATQRRGYFAAGVSFATGQKLDLQAEDLNGLLFLAEDALDKGDLTALVDNLNKFSELVFKIPPFVPDELPGHWKEIVARWIAGNPVTEIVAMDPERASQFIEEIVVYKLVWAAEAVRVRSVAHQDMFASVWTGRVAAALEAGSISPSAVVLLQAGLGSRIAALSALRDVPGSFVNYQGMRDWLQSRPVAEASQSGDWPTPETSDLWGDFVHSTGSEAGEGWTVQRRSFPVTWDASVTVTAGELVRVSDSSGDGTTTDVYSAEFRYLGKIMPALPRLEGIFSGAVGESAEWADITYFGPGRL